MKMASTQLKNGVIARIAADAARKYDGTLERPRAAGTHHCKPGGGAGQAAGGRQPGGGCQPVGGSGQPGGEFQRASATSLPSQTGRVV